MYPSGYKCAAISDGVISCHSHLITIKLLVCRPRLTPLGVAPNESPSLKPVRLPAVSAFQAFADWSSHMEETWSDTGYYPMSLIDEANGLGNHDEDAVEDSEELSTEQMIQHIEERFMYYATCWRITRMTSISIAA